MPEPTVIVTFDVTEPHLQNCLDSLTRQRDESQAGAAAPGGAARTDIEVVLVPVRATNGARRSAPAEPESADPDTNGDDEGSEADSADVPDEPRPEENDQGDEAVESAREDGLATAVAFTKTPPAGLRVTLLPGEPAPNHPEARSRGGAAAQAVASFWQTGGVPGR